MTINIVYIMVVYFALISLFGLRKYKIHATIIFISCFLNILFQMPESTDVVSFIRNRNVSILWDSATGFILISSIFFGKLAGRQALLLAFAVLCHIMIIYEVSGDSLWYGHFIRASYTELIVMVGLLQMGVSYNGFTTALSNLQGIVFRFFLYSNSCVKGFFARKERERKT